MRQTHFQFRLVEHSCVCVCEQLGSLANSMHCRTLCVCRWHSLTLVNVIGSIKAKLLCTQIDQHLCDVVTWLLLVTILVKLSHNHNMVTILVKLSHNCNKQQKNMKKCARPAHARAKCVHVRKLAPHNYFLARGNTAWTTSWPLPYLIILPAVSHKSIKNIRFASL